MNMERIKNALPPMDGAPATGGQPTEEQLRVLAEAGTRAVVNLGLLDPAYCLPDEAGLVEGLGMIYHHLPVAFDAPTVEDLGHFFSIMDSMRDYGVFVHCAMNYRATCFVALYGEKRLGWPKAQADAYIARVWDPDPVWGTFLARIREEIGKQTSGCSDLFQEREPG